MATLIAHDSARLQFVKLAQPEWQALAPKMYGYGFRQTWAYAQSTAGHQKSRCEPWGLFRDQHCLALASVRVRSIRHLGGIAYISGGPLLQPGPQEALNEALHAALEGLVQEFVHRRGLLLRIAPPIEWVAEAWDATPVFQRLQFVIPDRRSLYRTFMLDLSPSVEQLRKNLDSQWRRYLCRAEKEILTIHEGEEIELLERFCPLHNELMKRKGFSVELSAEFYRDLQGRLDASDKLRVRLVEVDGRIVAGHIASALNQTSVALLVASNELGNQLKLTHLLHWRAILDAKERGCAWYDLGGINPVTVPGVYQFKKLIRGTDLTAPGPFELYPPGIRSHLVQLAEQWYRKYLQLRAT